MSVDKSSDLTMETKSVSVMLEVFMFKTPSRISDLNDQVNGLSGKNVSVWSTDSGILDESGRNNTSAVVKQLSTFVESTDRLTVWINRDSTVVRLDTSGEGSTSSSRISD
ncbi:hypothetical protein WICPIJ_006887 [Wickerhamomyces pijperi]|uniref:Uncharacterized protein n=1 Tax=Wickerhamomyces pijperi TaxID=599730 RepID=A0A9P8Q0X0_WICPI|nr:hypothetical protein WICPIJ_006887 [Wickerhamomyces pijperi]